MKVKDLISRLKECDEELDVVVGTTHLLPVINLKLLGVKKRDYVNKRNTKFVMYTIDINGEKVLNLSTDII